ncbi:MAG: aminotransferase class V-fold PLP-dependent enzyme [Curvibacter lanceolatus]|jgi:selenocysteine lyase/cysteine desulfurase|uniref:aminotransferase class V-fold PLP-dependent enzyme n=1 Tax=Curvibacter lanceolatus TaxID=86182 RepID=UPI0003803C26|nr:aminotransferase class V-fold PLP-dependent enzyme [Curvibacter lanceolatus]MBV5293555.1 aminotransferase class V-fold PLP-dependent enzyme [Curvibacter lanceolatus]
MDWHTRFRAYFPLALQKAYACQAYSSPMSPEVSQAVAVFFDRLTHGRSDKPEWLAAAQSVRRQVAQLIHAEAGQIAFTKNTTEGLNLVAQGYPWQPGDNLVIDDQEHPVNVVPWLNLRHRGVEVRVAATVDHRITLEALWQRVDARTRIVAVSHAQYGTGFRIDLQALGERCRNAGIALVVDGIQTVGLLPVDVQTWGISALACGAYKALHGPLGLGFVYVAPALLERLHPTHLGASAVNQVDRSVPGWALRCSDLHDARRLEGGNINYPAIYGLARALLLIEEARVDRLAPWTLGLARRLDAGLRQQGYQLLSSKLPGEDSHIVCLRHELAYALRKYLYSQRVMCNLLDSGALRFSLGGYNTEADVDLILAVTGRFARDPGLRRLLQQPVSSTPYPAP